MAWDGMKNYDGMYDTQGHSNDGFEAGGFVGELIEFLVDHYHLLSYAITS